MTKYRVHPEAVPAYANSATRPAQCAPTGLPIPHGPLRRASNDGRYPVLSLDPQRRRKKTLEAFVAQIESLSWAEPLLMILRGCVRPAPHFGMETPVRRVIFVLLALTATAHAQAVVFTFDQWARLSAGLQEIYISGAMDAVFTIAVPAQAATAKFYNDCVVNKQIKAHDIVEEMKVIVRSRPELYPKPGTAVLLESLIKLCGAPNP